MTILLGRAQVIEMLDPAALVPLLKQAFASYSQARPIPAQRLPSPLPSAGSAMILVPGLIDGIPAYTVKIHAKFPGETPAIKGVILLHDLTTGDLLAVMDSTYITAVRTGLAAAIATDLLARQDASRVAVIGAGTQGEYQARFLSQLRVLSSVSVYDTDPQKAQTFARRIETELSIPVAICANVNDVTAEADIILAATWAREPFLNSNLISDGVHITTLGPDQPGKAEVDAALIREAMFVCDDRDLAIKMGAVGNVGLGIEAIDAEIGEILSGQHPGRTTPDQITVYGSVGLAFQDLAAAWQVYQTALKEPVQDDFDFLQ